MASRLIRTGKRLRNFMVTPIPPLRQAHARRWLLTILLIWLACPSARAMHETVPPADAGLPDPMVAAGETPALDLGAFSTIEQIIPQLLGKRVIFVGEQHTRYDHHLTQLEIIRRLHEHNPDLAIGMEAFQQPFQWALDEYVSGDMDEQAMLRATEYYKRWRMDYRLYAPILRYAREHGLPVVALNLPVELTRQVGRHGLESLSPEARSRLPAEIDRSDRAYEQRIRDVFTHHPNDSGQPFERFLEVQLLWDEGMAERAAGFLADNPDDQLVILAGNGHIAWGSAIPQRLTRRIPVETATIINDWNGPVGPGLADYLLLPEKLSLPPAGRMGALLDETDEAVFIETCLSDSPCSAAGMRRGDRITRIEDADISSLTDLRLALWNRQPGDTIRIEILRPRLLLKDKVMSHDITLQ
jgi:uncharacterized iron-regulated protein